MTHTYEGRPSFGMEDKNGLVYVCSTSQQVIDILIQGGSFQEDGSLIAFNKEYPKIYVDSDDKFKNLKADIEKRYKKGFDHWRKWCNFLDGEL